MKLVIQTQYAENYGAHSWNGEGECPQFWKNKGGSTYVVPNITQAQARRIQDYAIPTLDQLLSYRSDSSSEHILSYDVVEDGMTVCEEWETPIMLAWDQANACWQARADTPSDVGWQEGYAGKVETWVLGMEGKRLDYKCEYIKTEEVANG